MPIDGISSAQNVAAQAFASDATSRIPNKVLGQSEFFKLIAVQFASQDPLKPMEDTSFIAQLANFSALENSTQLSADFGRFADRQDFAAAQNLLGRNVTLLDAYDTEVVGVVSAVRDAGENTLITVNGTEYDVGSVSRVELPTSESTDSN
jgi:flagellar basal-body rod modification protein FlgD